MGISISRKEVFDNLVRFKDNVSQMRSDVSRRKEGDRSYKVLLNCRTGAMRFTQKISALETHMAQQKSKPGPVGEWKEAKIIVHQKHLNEGAYFEICDSHNHQLQKQDLVPTAWHITRETLDALNGRAKEVRGSQGQLLIEEAILNDLSSIHLAAAQELIEGAAGWMGSISRIDAEKMLSKRPVGTYLLREADPLAQAISFHFAEENQLSVRPYLLTVVESDKKIVDILLLQTSRGWLLYHDDPNLKDSQLYHYFSSVQEVLQSIGKVAIIPLSHV